MEILFYILAGGIIGFIVGLTGVGGGALMTPALLLFGFPAHIAIGTDLWFAAITKSGGIFAHQKKGHIRWQIALNLASGSIPAAIITGLILALWFNTPDSYSTLLKSALGTMLIITSLVIMFKKNIASLYVRPALSTSSQYQWSMKLFITGLALGALVTLSSVGAGAVGTAILMILYPSLLPKEVVGTDIAHAVPLTFIAGVVHLILGNVNFFLLFALLCGSLPAIYVGTHLSSKIPGKILHPVLASLLMVLGMKYALF